MDPLEPLKVGWLQKKNSFRWSKRYFVLTRTTLAYYGSDETRQNPKQSFFALVADTPILPLRLAGTPKDEGTRGARGGLTKSHSAYMACI
jgi:hypothetical protein